MINHNTREEKVLVIDDDAAIRNYLARFLERRGFSAITAENGIMGLDVCATACPDIIILDVRMPDMDGLEVMTRVRIIHPHIPIILITAYSETETAMSALRLGALDYLTKPVNAQELTASLGRAREKVRLHKEECIFPGILLAEDEVTTRNRLSRVLEKEGYHVFQAADGGEALLLFREKKIDIVILDLKMPGLDGLQTLKRMRETGCDFEAIIFTAFGDVSCVIQAMHCGVINVLPKPIDLEQLLAEVRKAAERVLLCRALKYRLSESEISRQIMAYISTQKQMVVSLPAAPGHFFDSLPLGILIIDKFLGILFQNRYVKEQVNSGQNKIDSAFIHQLESRVDAELTFKLFSELVHELYHEPFGRIKKLDPNGRLHLQMGMVAVSGMQKIESAVFVVAQCMSEKRKLANG